jgi:hypothetical protein
VRSAQGSKAAKRGWLGPPYRTISKALTMAAVPIDREIPVETCRARQAKPFHDRKARPIDGRESLVGEIVPNRPCGLQIGRGHHLNLHCTASEAIPK